MLRRQYGLDLLKSQSKSIGLKERIVGKVYVAAFLLPTPVTKRLTDIGWEFESPVRLPENLIAVLEDAFGVRPVKAYLGMDVLEGEGLKFTAIRDSAGRIENISAQLRGREPNELCATLASVGLGNIEVFVPSVSDA